MFFSRESGFSLVELMIVVVIIGILTSVAIPAYQDYVIRAKVVNMVALVQPAKLAVTEAIISGTKPSIEPLKDQGFIKDITLANESITITGDAGKLGIKSSDKNKTELKITFTPNSENQSVILWRCSVEPSDFKKYAPAECR